MVRVGPRAQPAVIAALNEHFVPVEFDANDAGGVPDHVPAFWPLASYWKESTFSRVNFSGEWVLDPAGEFILGAAVCKHRALEDDYLQSLHAALERGWQRYATYRDLEPGSPGWRELRERAEAEGRRDVERNKACWLSDRTMTEHLLAQAAFADPARAHNLSSTRSTRCGAWPSSARSGRTRTGPPTAWRLSAADGLLRLKCIRSAPPSTPQVVSTDRKRATPANRGRGGVVTPRGFEPLSPG